jgi:hypothetical protein
VRQSASDRTSRESVKEKGLMSFYHKRVGGRPVWLVGIAAKDITRTRLCDTKAEAQQTERELRREVTGQARQQAHAVERRPSRVRYLRAKAAALHRMAACVPRLFPMLVVG